MKNWLEKIKAARMGPWMLLAAVCAAAFLLFSVNPLTKSPAVTMTEEEQRLSATLSSIAGAGEIRVSIYYAQAASAFGGTGARTPIGAVIVAQGAGDVAVRLNLLRAAETLLGLSASQVEVFPMEESGDER